MEVERGGERGGGRRRGKEDGEGGRRRWRGNEEGEGGGGGKEGRERGLRERIGGRGRRGEREGRKDTDTSGKIHCHYCVHHTVKKPT